MVLHIVMHICRVQLVSVMNKAIRSSVTVPARTAGLKERGRELVMLVFFPDPRYFCLYNYMHKSRNKFSVFKDLAEASFILLFQISQTVVGMATGGP